VSTTTNNEVRTMTTQQTQQTQAIQVREREPLPFVPNNMEQAWRTSELLAKSSLIPDALKGKPHDVLISILSGAELGIQPMQALREIYVVKGRPFIASLLRVAMIRQSPECLMWQLVETTPQRATFRTQRRGDLEPTTMTYTIQEAEAAGLVAQNARYRTDPALQLRRRCAGRLIDEVYPDIIRGVGAREDAEEEPEFASASQARRAAVQPPHLRATQDVPEAPPPAPIEDAQVVGDTPAPTASSPSGDPSEADLFSLAIAEAQTRAEISAVSDRIIAARDAGRLPIPVMDALRAELVARKKEVRQ